jgi:hypothetical protein
MSAVGDEELVSELRLYASWVAGPRSARINALIDRVQGEGDSAEQTASDAPAKKTTAKRSAKKAT